MADKEPFESLTGIAQQTADQITQQTKVAMENYLTWFQNAMSPSQWANVDLNKKLLSYATHNVIAAELSCIDPKNLSFGCLGWQAKPCEVGNEVKERN